MRADKVLKEMRGIIPAKFQSCDRFGTSLSHSYRYVNHRNTSKPLQNSVIYLDSDVQMLFEKSYKHEE